MKIFILVFFCALAVQNVITAKKSAPTLHKADGNPMTMTQLAKVKSKTKSRSHAKLAASMKPQIVVDDAKRDEKWNTYFGTMSKQAAGLYDETNLDDKGKPTNRLTTLQEMIDDYIDGGGNEENTKMSSDDKREKWDAIYDLWSDIQNIFKQKGCVPPPPPQALHGRESPIETQCRTGYSTAFYEVQIWASLIYYDQLGKHTEESYYKEGGNPFGGDKGKNPGSPDRYDAFEFDPNDATKVPDTAEWKMLEWFNRCLRNFIESKTDVKHLCGRKGFEQGMIHWYGVYFEKDGDIAAAETDLANHRSSEANGVRYQESYNSVVKEAKNTICNTQYVNTKIAAELFKINGVTQDEVTEWQFKCGPSTAPHTIKIDSTIWMEKGKSYNVYCGTPEFSHCVNGECRAEPNVLQNRSGDGWDGNKVQLCQCPNKADPYTVPVAKNDPKYRAQTPCENGTLKAGGVASADARPVYCYPVLSYADLAKKTDKNLQESVTTAEGLKNYNIPTFPSADIGYDFHDITISCIFDDVPNVQQWVVNEKRMHRLTEEQAMDPTWTFLKTDVYPHSASAKYEYGAEVTEGKEPWVLKLQCKCKNGTDTKLFEVYSDVNFDEFESATNAEPSASKAKQLKAQCGKMQADASWCENGSGYTSYCFAAQASYYRSASISFQDKACEKAPTTGKQEFQGKPDMREITDVRRFEELNTFLSGFRGLQGCQNFICADLQCQKAELFQPQTP